MVSKMPKIQLLMKLVFVNALNHAFLRFHSFRDGLSPALSMIATMSPFLGRCHAASPFPPSIHQFRASSSAG